MKNNIQKYLSEENELINALAGLLAIKKGIRDKQIYPLAVFESEIGKFPDDLHEFGKRLMRLQGLNPDEFYQQKKFNVIEGIYDTENNDRVFIVVIAF